MKRPLPPRDVKGRFMKVVTKAPLPEELVKSLGQGRRAVVADEPVDVVITSRRYYNTDAQK